MWISLPKNSLFSVQKNQKFHFCPKCSKMIFLTICPNKIFILSCFTISQHYLVFRTSQKKPLDFEISTQNQLFYPINAYMTQTRSSSRGVLMKVIFSKSSDHVEHFHILRFFHISRSYGDITRWRSVLNTLSEPTFPSKSYLRVSGNDSSWICIQLVLWLYYNLNGGSTPLFFVSLKSLTIFRSMR